jgi:hypothetical protein
VQFVSGGREAAAARNGVKHVQRVEGQSQHVVRWPRRSWTKLSDFI